MIRLDIEGIFRLQRLFPCLRLGSEGGWSRSHLLKGGLDRAEAPECLAMACQILDWSWQERPLDKAALSLLASLDQSVSFLGPKAGVYCRALDKRLAVPDADPAWEELLVSTDVEGTGRFCLERAGDPVFGLYWLGAGFERLLELGGFGEAAGLIDKFGSSGALGPLLARLRSELAFHALGAEAALERALEVDNEIFPLWRALLVSELRNRLEPQTALSDEEKTLFWSAPWRTSLILKLHDRVFPPPPPLFPDDPDQVRILLYSWNKERDLDQTLESLKQSRIGPSRVVVLDNGSSDDTGAVIARHERDWPGGGLESVCLPVNIGAPQARNWLLSLDRVKGAKWLAFLDDDVILPENWLGELLSAGENDPGAGVVGCRVTGAERPLRIQSADFNLLPPEGCASGFKDLKENILVFNNCIGQRDLGLFTYTRPCVSVTGCCHMIRAEEIEKSGGFDIRFSPSQFDDLERDLRAFRGGSRALFHGRLAVRHTQYSSLSQAVSRARQGHIFGNKIKLEHLFTPDQAKRMVQRQNEMLDNDLRAKTKRLFMTVNEPPANPGSV